MQNGGQGASFLLVIVLGVVLSGAYIGVHKVYEGHIGVYWRGGALLSTVTDPGYHLKVPFVTAHANVQVTLQTDIVKDIPCGTSGGVLIYFDKIEVVNRLNREHAHKTIKNYGVHYDKIWIFDKIHHEINQFCSSHTLQEVYIDHFDKLDEALAYALQESCDKWETGISIIAIRVTKPRIPESVRRNYEAVEEAKTALLLATQRSLVAKREAETERMRMRIEAEREAEIAIIASQREANVSKIATEKEVLKKEGERRKQDIENAMHVSKEKAKADALHYMITQQSDANKLLYTEGYLRYVLYTSLANNTKIYFGEKIPTMFLDFLGRDASQLDDMASPSTSKKKVSSG